jgi:hypothetical protein
VFNSELDYLEEDNIENDFVRLQFHACQTVLYIQDQGLLSRTQYSSYNLGNIEPEACIPNSRSIRKCALNSDTILSNNDIDKKTAAVLLLLLLLLELLLPLFCFHFYFDGGMFTVG